MEIGGWPSWVSGRGRRFQGGYEALRLGTTPQEAWGWPRPIQDSQIRPAAKGPGILGDSREQAGPEAGRRQEGAGTALGAAWAGRSPAGLCKPPGAASGPLGGGTLPSAPRDAGGGDAPGG